MKSQLIGSGIVAINDKTKNAPNGTFKYAVVDGAKITISSAIDKSDNSGTDTDSEVFSKRFLYQNSIIDVDKTGLVKAELNDSQLQRIDSNLKTPVGLAVTASAKTENTSTTGINNSGKIEADRTYYGQLKKEKVNVTFRVGDIDKEKVTIEKGQTFNDAKKAVTFNISEYEWFEDEAFDTPAVVDKQILENKIYFGKLKVTANNGNNDNNGDNNNNNNNGDNNNNNNNGDNNNNNNNDNNGNNNNNGNTTPVVPTVPSNNITIPDETTPLSPTTPDTEDKDTNDNINIEDDDTALGTAVIDDKSEDEDATIPVKDGKKVTANEDNSVDIASEDTPLGTTLPKTGGSLGITYILLGLLISVLGIKKFREK